MIRIPAAAEPLVKALGGVFTRPTLDRFIVLMSGLIVTMGRHTVSRAIKAVEPKLQGHWCNYHRIYSSAKYSMWSLALALTRQVIALLPADEPIVLLADDTVDGKEADHVWAKGAHRDAVRSSGSKAAIKFGHKWLVMCVWVQLPSMARGWALPILCGMCISPKVSKTIKRRPKTPSQITRQLLMRMMRWFPDRTFILIGDYQVVSHETASFARRHRDRVTAIGHLRGDANLYGQPLGLRRHARKGRKQPSPSQRIKQLTPRRQKVRWYGSSYRMIRHVSEESLWFNKHSGQVTPIRWVCVLADPKLGLIDSYYYSSDPTMDAKRIIELYAMRWNIEVTFQESRALLGLETTRHWCRQSVLRVTPMLLGLFTAVSLLWKELYERKGQPLTCLSETPCYRKRHLTFADALYWVRRELWETTLLEHDPKTPCLSSLPPKLRQTLLWHLAAAA
jgi:hypothetical protein